jgi:hypothetical protein
MGRRTSKPDVQMIGLRSYQYLMSYKVLAKRHEIRIIRIRHMRRQDAADIRGL